MLICNNMLLFKSNDRAAEMPVSSSQILVRFVCVIAKIFTDTGDNIAVVDRLNSVCFKSTASKCSAD